MRRGEIWWANLSAPAGRWPVLLLSRDAAYTLLSRVVIAPLTTRLRDMPSGVWLDPRSDGVPQRSVVSVDNMQAVPIAWLDDFIVLARPEKMREVEQAIHFALGLSY